MQRSKKDKKGSYEINSTLTGKTANRELQLGIET